MLTLFKLWDFNKHKLYIWFYSCENMNRLAQEYLDYAEGKCDDPSGAIGLNLANLVGSISIKEIKRMRAKLDCDIESCKKAFNREQQILPCDTKIMKDILRELKEKGYPIQPYSNLRQRELHNYFESVRRDIFSH